MTNALEIRNLTKNYKDFSLDGINLVLPTGCIMGLVGENGAGKSTTIKLILDAVKRDGGEITVLGRSGSEMTLAKNDIGVVPDEIGIPGMFTPQKLEKVMKLTFDNWDSEVFNDYLERLSVPKDKRFKEFSKGMKMKLGIAVALSHHPKLLLLDEPTSGLDPVVRDEVVDIFMNFTRDEEHSIFISSHIVSDLEKLCDYIAFLHKGRLMLCEEKDVLRDSYRIVRGKVSEIEALPDRYVIGKKITPYGAEAIVRREAVPAGLESDPADIEQLFIFMVRKEERI